MLINLDRHQILYYLEGCARGSHLRQGCWHDMIALYPKMDQGTRDYLYTYAKRDIAPIFNSASLDETRPCVSTESFRPCGAEDFDQFLACFDKDNRYMVTATDGERTETREAYLYNGHYYTGVWMRVEDEYITDVTKI